MKEFLKGLLFTLFLALWVICVAVPLAREFSTDNHMPSNDVTQTPVIQDDTASCEPVRVSERPSPNPRPGNDY